MNPYHKTFVAIDLETTGLDPESGSILEVAAVKFRRGVEVDSFKTLVHPGRPIPFIVTDITGITDEDVALAPKYTEVREKLEEFIGQHPVVGHNVAFDLAFLRANDTKIDTAVFDTWKLATIAFTDFASYSLENIAGRLGLDTGNSHRAYDDARLSGNLFLRIMEEIISRYPKSVLQDVNEFIRRRDWSSEDVFATIIESAKEGITASTPEKSTKLSPKSFKEARDLFACGEIKELIPGFTTKDTQVALTDAIVASLSKKSDAFFEVMPDSGRLVSALAASCLAQQTTKEKTLLSVMRTTALSSQFQNDIATMQTLFPKVRVTLAAPRESYLCRKQLEAFMQRQDMTEIEIDVVVKVLLWLSVTKTGNMDELALLREQRFIARELSFEGCSFHHEECFAFKAKQELEKADVVIADHATLIRTLSREEVFASLKNIVIDEAEELEESATKALSQVFSQGIVLEYFDVITRKAPGIGFLERVMNDVGDTVAPEVEKSRNNVEDSVRAATLLFGILGIGVKKWGSSGEETNFSQELTLTPSLLDEREGKNIQASCETFRSAIQNLIDTLKVLDAKLHDAHKELFYHELSALIAKLQSLQAGISEVILEQKPQWINWIVLKPDKDFFMKKAPISVAQFMKKNIFENKNIVFLARNASFQNEVTYICDRIGAEGFALKTFGQGNVEKKVQMLIASDVADFKSPKYLAQSLETIMNTLTKVGKSALIIVPTYTACKTYYEKLKPELAALGYDVFSQAVSGGRHKIAEKIAKREKTVFIATPNFLHEMKLSQEKQRLIIMLKFPFAPGFDPVTKAREATYGTSAFWQFALPRALHLFRSIFFRLMQNEDATKTALVLLDSRFAKARYAEPLLASLPKHNVEHLSCSTVSDRVANWLS